MARRDHFDAGHGNPEHSLEGIMSKREQDRIAGEALGGHLWDSMEEMMGGPGSYKASLNLAATGHAHENFRGEDIRFDEEDYPYLHHQVTPSVHVEYPIPHEASKSATEEDKDYFYATAYKTNARGQKAALDALYIPGEARHNPRYIKESAQEWVDETYKPNQEGYDANARGSYE